MRESFNICFKKPDLCPFWAQFMNLGASLVKQVANATNDVAGDGAPLFGRYRFHKLDPAMLLLLQVLSLPVR